MLPFDQAQALANYKAELAEEARRRKERDRVLWQRIAAQVPFELTVRTDVHSTSPDPLRHGVPAIDLRTGGRRQHPAGRALCQGLQHSHLMELSAPLDSHATCMRCVHAAAVARPADAPGPPTRTERRELERVRAGAVFTIEHAEGPEIRDTSEQSRIPGGDQGRKVTAVIKRLHTRGWVDIDAAATESPRGARGRRWHLTRLGATALAIPAEPRWVEATPEPAPQVPTGRPSSLRRGLRVVHGDLLEGVRGRVLDGADVPLPRDA
jgi:hypothetical protein